MNWHVTPCLLIRFVRPTPGGHRVWEWEGDPQPADLGKDGESPGLETSLSFSHETQLFDHAIDIHSLNIHHPQASNCEARTRASPWKPRPQVNFNELIYNREIQTCLHLIRLSDFLSQVARRSRQVLGQTWRWLPKVFSSDYYHQIFYLLRDRGNYFFLWFDCVAI